MFLLKLGRRIWRSIRGTTTDKSTASLDIFLIDSVWNSYRRARDNAYEKAVLERVAARVSV